MAAAGGTSTDVRFPEIFEHLAEYHWIHDLHLTKFLESQVWTKIPHEWDEAFKKMTGEDLNRLPFPEACASLFRSSSNHCGHPIPPSLQQFLLKSFSLTLNRQHIGCRLNPTYSLTLNGQQVGSLLKPTPVGKELARGMSPKKLHEVEWMASLVHQVAVQAACNVVVDIGSGLGYLGQVLHTNYGLPVIGLEGSVGHTQRADKRAAKHGLQCSGMNSVPFEIRDDADNIHKFCELVQDVASTMTPCEHSLRTHLHSQCSCSHCAQVSAETMLETHTCGCDLQQRTSETTLETHTCGCDPQQRTSETSLEIHTCGCDTRQHVSESELTILRMQARVPFTVPAPACTRELKESVSPHLNSEISQRNVSQPDGVCFVCRETQRTEKLCICETKMSQTSGNVQETRTTQASENHIKQIVQQLQNSAPTGRNVRVCLVGLHCCGDLTPALLRLFQQVNFIQAVCCVSCCYHKMQLVPGTDSFHNFPMSDAAKEAHTAAEHTQEMQSPENVITPCSLRLAAQETRSRWAAQTRGDHESHTRNVAFRAMLELLGVFVAEGRSTPINRKTVRKFDYSSLDKFIDSYLSSLGISDEEEKATEKNLRELYSEVQPLFRHIEPFTCLQVVLQPVLESLVLQDRQRWLEEHGFSADIVPIFDEEMSPRNQALVSIKL